MSVTDANHIEGFERCSPYNSALSSLGIAIGMSVACLGSAYGTARAGKGVLFAGQISPNSVMKNSLPVIMAGILGIYGLITGIAIQTTMTEIMPFFQSASHFAAGISTGVSALAAGLTIGIAGDSAVRAVARLPQLYVVMLLILVFGEALSLYGVIISLILALKTGEEVCPSIYNPSSTDGV